MKNRFFIFYLVLIIIICGSCEKLSLSSNKFKVKEFPITLGSYWEYERTDSVNFVVDTVRGTVIEEGATYADQKGLWKIEWKNKKGEFLKFRYVEKEKDTVTVYIPKSNPAIDYLSIESRYIFPLELGVSWWVSEYIGTHTVTDDDASSEIYGQDFGEGYLINRRGSLDRSHGVFGKIMMVEDIGVVWLNDKLTVGSNPTSHEIYRLIDFYIE